MDDGKSLVATDFPEDWQFYTLNHPVTRHGHLSLEEIRNEMRSCTEEFYSLRRVLSRVVRNIWRRCEPKLTLAGNLSFRVNGQASQEPDMGIERPSAVIGRNGHVGGDLRALGEASSSLRHARSSAPRSSST
jgi:hypothetical protein